ncbi:hypothetical protein OsJ_19645 [Oryza sativa Japonica Group]|uniref:RNase H type-1 domain-containing protein n=1 Tax=Oryza sativa subsp. japonica TaxID=39947 RepID=B9FIH0_ORYSJ|nr:hypothetical protein OsJ_19645 [Oryza sativa Japonica Group]
MQNYAEILSLVRQATADPNGKSGNTLGGVSKPSVKEIHTKSKWQPPPEGWAKINVDGAFDQGDGRCGIGVVIRDCLGRVLLSSWRYLRRCSQAEEAELLACSEGINLAAEWIHLPVILESDCLMATTSIAGKDMERSRWTFLLREIKAAVRRLQEVSVHHVNRECNRVAHELAQLAKRTAHCAVWRDQAPSCILHVLRQDCNLVP